MNHATMNDEQLKAMFKHNIDLMNALSKMAVEFFGGVSRLQRSIIDNSISELVAKMRDRGIYSDEILKFTQSANEMMLKAVSEGEQFSTLLGRTALDLTQAFAEQCQANAEAFSSRKR